MKSVQILLLLLFVPSFATAADFVYLHTFKLPELTGINFRRHTFNGSSGPLAFIAPDRLLVRGHSQFNDCAYINIAGSGEAAGVIGDWFDPSVGAIPAKGFINAMDADGDQLLCGVNHWYNVSGESKPTLFLADLKTGERGGLWSTPFHSNANGNLVSRASPEMTQWTKGKWLSAGYTAQGTRYSNWGPSLYTLPQVDLTLAADSRLKSEAVIAYPISQPLDGWHPTHAIYSLHDLETETLWIGRETSGRKWYGEKTFTFPDGDSATDSAVTAKGYHAETYSAVVWSLSHKSIQSGQRDFVKQPLKEVKNPAQVISAALDRQGRRLFVLDKDIGVHMYHVTP